ncbi:MAG: ASCH domain-containing protein [Candidatus Asgardarchaeia archaeon]
MYLISLKPRYAKFIVEGIKTYELRRWVPNLSRNSRIIIYASNPLKAIIGEFKVNNVYKLPLDKLWRLVSKGACLSHEEFLKYFRNMKEGYAIEIKDSVRYRRYLYLKEIREVFPDFNPPVDFLRLKGSLRRFIASFIEFSREK